MRRKILRAAAFFLFAGMMLIGGGQLLKIHRSYREAAERYAETAARYTEAVITVSDTTTDTDADHPHDTPQPPISVDFAALKAAYPDVVGWLYCEGTPINYPVAQGDDNSYYLRRDLDGNYAMAGTLFLDYRCSADFSDENSVIYGHNMNDGSMFAVLPDFSDPEFLLAHPTIWLLTETESTPFAIAGCRLAAAEDAVGSQGSHGAVRGLTLSTCAEREDERWRLTAWE